MRGREVRRRRGRGPRQEQAHRYPRSNNRNNPVPQKMDDDDYSSDNEDLDISNRLSSSDQIRVVKRKSSSKNIFDQISSDNNNNNNNDNDNNNNTSQRITRKSSYPNNRDYDRRTNQKIEKNSDIIRELNAKLNPKLKNVDLKIFNELEKFDKIVDYISKKLMKKDTGKGFFKLCQVFALNDLKNCKDMNRQSSIFSIFSEGDKFRLDSVIHYICASGIMDEEFPVSDENIAQMFDFFKVLVDVSLNHKDNLDKIMKFMLKFTDEKPCLTDHIDDFNKYCKNKEEKVINSLESLVSPVASDLLYKKKVTNRYDQPWDSFDDYKKAMIDLTKENFYNPFRTTLTQLKEKTLDSRDLFLYENVFIAFTSNIGNYSMFKDCNFFLSFKIRTPPNCKRKLKKPDWKRTEQLGNRSLLILSKSPELLTIDAVCRSCAVARSPIPEQSRATTQFLDSGIVPVVLISGQIEENRNYYMFEPTSCWPAVQPVLQRLLKMNEISFPSYFMNKIVKLDFSHNTMEETNQIPTDTLLLDGVPEGRKSEYLKMASERWEFDRFSHNQIDALLRVDHEQYKALRYALRHNLTLVNGAPGTGKTHYAREYLRVMTKLQHPKPIAVITYTNHALDAILEGVLPFINPNKLIRWGGPMRSTNEILISRKWKNKYLPGDILTQRDEIVTMKQNLKNMYNIRQMSVQCIDALKKNPSDLRVYQTIMRVLDHFFNAYKTMASRYQIDLNEDEINEYNRYQKNRDERITRLSLPNDYDSLVCWINGEEFYLNRNNKYRDILKQNRSVVLGDVYHNRFEGLNDDDDDDDYEYAEDDGDGDGDKRKKVEEDDDFDANYESYEEEEDGGFVKKKKANKEVEKDEKESNPSPEDFSINSSAANKTQSFEFSKESKAKDDDDNNNDNDDADADVDDNGEEEEEEEEADDKVYNDEDIIEMTRVSLDGTEIKENLPKKYVDDILKGKFNNLFAVKDKSNTKKPSELMIAYLKDISEPLTQMIKMVEEELQQEEIRFNEYETKEAGRYLQDMKLIGMTSTVASVRKEALEVAGCEILIVEEAGELTESMLCCILPSTLKRLILIGDYQQLRPKVEHELTKPPYNYDVSLFEKLVVSAKEQNAKCLFTLSVQRRMHPEISQLIRLSFYNEGKEEINDADSTNDLGKPYGIPHRVRFYMHNYEEDKISTRSHANSEEAKFCASLVPFFICRGYKAEDITIISLYKGQMYAIQREIEALFNQFKKSNSQALYNSFGNIKHPKQVKVVVLDNFQGEENKIIIVSLTRSIKPGFVKNRNRALVTLSRAREMLVVLGHERIFGKDCKDNLIWRKISEVASNISEFSMSKPNQKGLAVNHCAIHNRSSADLPHFLEKPNDILRYRFSFCSEKCNFVLPCGHQCQLVCHCHSYPPGPNEHDEYYCQFTCTRRCPNGHQCTRKCGVCTHKGECPPCRVKIHHRFEACGHEANIECYKVTSGKAKCDAKCGKELACGHKCDLKCGHLGGCNCRVKLEKQCPDCRRYFSYTCGDLNPTCDKKCNHVLPCGHTCSSRCFECHQRGKHDDNCQHQCDFVFPCGHRCNKKCCEKFPLHQHFICHKKIQLNHNFVGNHSDSDKLAQECMAPICCNCECQHSCLYCGKTCTKRCSDKCIERCNCQCKIQCTICGAKCRALSGEKCAIFCPHFPGFEHVKEPPKEDGILYVFHDNHFLPLKEAKKRIESQFNAIVHGQSEVPLPIRRLTCPCDGCNRTEPCVIGSWFFDEYNKEIEDVIKRIRKKAERYIENKKNDKSEKSFDKIHWYTCDNCLQLFFVKFNDPNNIIVKCPKCGNQKGEMFE